MFTYKLSLNLLNITSQRPFIHESDILNAAKTTWSEPFADVVVNGTWRQQCRFFISLPAGQGMVSNIACSYKLMPNFVYPNVSLGHLEIPALVSELLLLNIVYT